MLNYIYIFSLHISVSFYSNMFEKTKYKYYLIDMTRIKISTDKLPHYHINQIYRVSWLINRFIYIILICTYVNSFRTFKFFTAHSANEVSRGIRKLLKGRRRRPRATGFPWDSKIKCGRDREEGKRASRQAGPVKCVRGQRKREGEKKKKIDDTDEKEDAL